MRVLSVHAGADTAGVSWLLSRAFERLSIDIDLRSCIRKTNYLRYPHDAPWSEAPALWADADVVHLHNTLRANRLLGGGKPFVLHHHGTAYRTHSDALNTAVRDLGGRAVVATLDLLDYGPDLTWVPAPFDLTRLAAFRKPQRGSLRVAHAPTDRDVKSTEAFLKACALLDVEPVLIERKAWADCLAIKGTCDVLYDQVQLGYGHNAIEAWAMGIPVIAGAPEPTLSRMRDTFGRLPFYTADETSIGDAIHAMTDPAVRFDHAALGMAHVRRWHDGGETVHRLTAIYRELAGG